MADADLVSYVVGPVELPDDYIAIPPWVIAMMLERSHGEIRVRSDLEPPLKRVYDAMVRGDTRMVKVQQKYNALTDTRTMSFVHIEPVTLVKTALEDQPDHGWNNGYDLNLYDILFLPRDIVGGLEHYWNPEWEVHNPHLYQRYTEIDHHYIQHSPDTRSLLHARMYAYYYNSDLKTHVYGLANPTFVGGSFHLSIASFDEMHTIPLKEIVSMRARFFIQTRDYRVPIVPPTAMRAVIERGRVGAPARFPGQSDWSSHKK
jgi:hypothetical protein